MNSFICDTFLHGAILTAMKLFTRPTHVQQVLSLTLVSSTYRRSTYRRTTRQVEKYDVSMYLHSV